MNSLYLPDFTILLSIITTLFFGVAAIIFSHREEHSKKKAFRQEQAVETSLQEKVSLEVIKSLIDGIFMVDRTLHLFFINDAARKALRIAKKSPSFLDIINALPPTYDLQKQIEEALSQNKTIEEKEITLSEKTLQLYITPLESSIHILSDGSPSKPEKVYVIVKDATFEKSLSFVRDDFLNMMIHELRAPITAVKGAAEMMIAKNSKVDKEQEKKLLDLIYDQAKKLLDQVSSLLDLAKIEASRFTIQKTPSNIKKLITQVVDVFTPQAKNKGITLVAHIDSDIPSLSIDTIRIGQVMNNLLSNSIKYTQEKGKITVKVKLIKEDPEKLEVSVEDTGIGIPQEKQGELFSKFYQTGQTQTGNITNHIPGSGLGLFITKEIIQAHGGSITLESQPAKGTTITFCLPV